MSKTKLILPIDQVVTIFMQRVLSPEHTSSENLVTSYTYYIGTYKRMHTLTHTDTVMTLFLYFSQYRYSYTRRSQRE